MLRASTSVVPQSHHQGAPEMKQFCPGMYYWGVAVEPPTLEGTIGGVRVTTQRVPWHRVGPRPQFPAEALMAPLDPTIFAPLRLPALFEFEWTQILTCNLVSFSNSTSSFIHGHIQGGDSYRARDWLPLWRCGHREIAGISSSRARVHAEVRLLPPSLLSCWVPNWLPVLDRHWGRRARNPGERRVNTSSPAFACAAFQSVQFFSKFYRFR